MDDDSDAYKYFSIYGEKKIDTYYCLKETLLVYLQ